MEHAVLNNKASAYLTQESTNPFDFEKTSLCRGSLIKFNEEYILLTIFHHIISDAWSVGIWNKELSSLYLSYKQGIEMAEWQAAWRSRDLKEIKTFFASQK